jgi:hypothetical protein
MKILIIGAGWYGCHIANYLIIRGVDITIVDKTNSIFTGSSFKNQNRLHLGYHYPRSAETITESIIGYNKFQNIYPYLATSFSKNLYFISKEQSYVDISSYIHIITDHISSHRFVNQETIPINIINVNESVLEVKEKYINPFKARELFAKELRPYMLDISDTNVFKSIDSIIEACNSEYSLVVNCTYNHLNPIEYEHYELFVTLLYKIDTPEVFGYTIMDGPFFSIYPYDIDNKIYTVTSVTHGVAYKGRKLEYELSESQLGSIRQKMEEQILQYIPDWCALSTYVSHYTSWKTKHNTVTDDRSVRYTHENGILNIYGGKITGIFEAEKIVSAILKLGPS